MKQLFVFLTLLVSHMGWSQTKPLNPILNNYLNLKNEQVAGNVQNSKKTATLLKEAVETINTKQLSAADLKAFEQVKGKMLNSLVSFLAAGDIGKQRDFFAVLSDQMIQLAKKTFLTDSEIYIDYCPMKKASWLSSEKAIRNPYYGNMMLSCGSIKETIKQ